MFTRPTERAHAATEHKVRVRLYVRVLQHIYARERNGKVVRNERRQEIPTFANGKDCHWSGRLDLHGEF